MVAVVDALLTPDAAANLNGLAGSQIAASKTVAAAVLRPAMQLAPVEVGADLGAVKLDAAKLAKHAHLVEEDEKEEQARKQKKEDPATQLARRNPLSYAWNAAKGKLMDGALMFGIFGTLLAVLSSVVLPAALELFGVAGGASADFGLFKLPLASSLAVPISGALWLGGNEFHKRFKEARELATNPQSELKPRERNGKHTVEQTVAATQAHGTNVTPIPLASRDHDPAPAVGGQAESAVARTSQPSTIQAILNQGPRQHAQDILANADKPANRIDTILQQGPSGHQQAVTSERAAKADSASVAAQV